MNTIRTGLIGTLPHAQDLHGSGHGRMLRAPVTSMLLPFVVHALYRAAAALGALAVRRKLESGQEIKTRCKAKTATRRQLDLADTGGKLAGRRTGGTFHYQGRGISSSNSNNVVLVRQHRAGDVGDGCAPQRAWSRRWSTPSCKSSWT